MATLKIEISDADVQRALRGLEQRASNFRPALESIGQYLLLRTRERFDQERGPDGRPWQPLSPRTVQRKARSRTALRGILKQSGKLRDTISYRVGSREVVLAAAQKYGGLHQFGGQVKRGGGQRDLYFRVDKKTGQSRFAKKSKANFQQTATFSDSTINIPARPFLGANAEDRQEFIEIIRDYLIQS